MTVCIDGVKTGRDPEVSTTRPLVKAHAALNAMNAILSYAFTENDSGMQEFNCKNCIFYILKTLPQYMTLVFIAYCVCYFYFRDGKWILV